MFPRASGRGGWFYPTFLGQRLGLSRWVEGDAKEISSRGQRPKGMNANQFRREEYQMAKRVERREGGSVFVKFAATPASRPFLNVIAEREKLASERFGACAETVTGRREGDTLVYPFLDQPTLEEEIRLEISRGGAGFGLSTVLQYKGFLENLPRLRCVPGDFYEFLGFQQKFDGESLDCIEFGPYDCIPRNLIRDADGWKVLDSEWTFPFPIPLDFLLWRGIHSLVYGLQQTIQSSVNAETPVVLYQGYGRTRVYMPLAWHIKFNFAQMNLDGFGAWESRFQQKILKPEAVRNGRLRITTQPAVYASLPKSRSLLICCEELFKGAAKTSRACFYGATRLANAI